MSINRKERKERKGDQRKIFALFASFAVHISVWLYTSSGLYLKDEICRLVWQLDC